MKISNFDDLIKYVKQDQHSPEDLELFSTNFKTYLNLCNDENIIILIKEMSNIPELQPILKSNASILSNLFKIEVVLKVTQTMDYETRYNYIKEFYKIIINGYYTPDIFFTDLLDNNEIEYICNNMDRIIIFNDIDTLIDTGILKKLHQLSPEKFEDIKHLIVAKISNPSLIFTDHDLLYALTTIIDEISKSENVDLSEIEYLGFGATSDVYKLGSKVIKFGDTRFTEKIPYHKRILQPLIRRNISSESGNIYIEISEYVESDKSITDEDVYLVYKELREAGIIWYDANPENLGRLKKENIIHYNEPLYVEDESVGFIPQHSVKDHNLQKGDLIITDTDLIFKENDPALKHIDSDIHLPYYKTYEKRYQEEKITKENNSIANKSKPFTGR